MNSARENSLLIADPFLKDENFVRSVIFLCSHNEEGSFGLALNKKFEYTIDQLIPGLASFALPVFVGGPVGLDTIHFLHQYPELIPDSQTLFDDLCWGGDFEKIKELVISKTIDINKIKFFIGYSGWSEGQLEKEIEEKTWLTCSAKRSLIFEIPPENIWKQSVLELGGEYEQIINYPIDPQLN